jgi:hypothetical protein
MSRRVRACTDDSDRSGPLQDTAVERLLQRHVLHNHSVVSFPAAGAWSVPWQPKVSLESVSFPARLALPLRITSVDVRRAAEFSIHLIAMIGLVWQLAIAILVIGLPIAAGVRGFAGAMRLVWR